MRVRVLVHLGKSAGTGERRRRIGRRAAKRKVLSGVSTSTSYSGYYGTRASTGLSALISAPEMALFALGILATLAALAVGVWLYLGAVREERERVARERAEQERGR